uniref:Epoxyqueuosine reductase n=1 Tax=Candidatus Kentrum sp. TUN TaxID=2126343 RepID=A0A450ZN50_9GAMM|nr:MAG: epoxyqueuosine reductase [Candidatus Kentron sp. TUN]VFK53373.1 MAG: epoxyqueuosine reductase [Candidatus Kentron sp. TUN]VFK55214.1 MAG: epoxyqueuosine reductase [Candidatus Kentron sp. TUN]
MDYQRLSEDIKCWGIELGFRHVGISSIDLTDDEKRLQAWLVAGYHGEMYYMARHGLKRSRPSELVPGTCRVISASMDYLPEKDITSAMRVLRNPHQGYVARYALGRDYHKVLRRRLVQLLQRIEKQIGQGQYRISHSENSNTYIEKTLPSSVENLREPTLRGGRVFVDSAPVLEKALARNAGLGWIGKHTNLIQRKVGSYFLLGEIYTNAPLSVDRRSKGHCGTCRACMTACPTGAIVAPYRLDARRCVAYLTIEYRGSIPLELRERIGNRIFGCDDCQLACPWNRFAHVTCEKDFLPRNGFDAGSLMDFFRWSETEFMERTTGSALRRIGYECWLRNIAVAIGNTPPSAQMAAVLKERMGYSSPLVVEHVAWALARHHR